MPGKEKIRMAISGAGKCLRGLVLGRSFRHGRLRDLLNDRAAVGELAEPTAGVVGGVRRKYASR